MSANIVIPGLRRWCLSPADPTALYLGTQYVMKTIDGGLHWETISPDLTGAIHDERAEEQRCKSATPPTLEEAKRAGYGVVFTVAPSPLNRDLIWAGSDTGLIHVTRDGGKNWNDVTPPGLSAWSKISLIEASHYDPAVAFAAVDRSRLDDLTPYIYRTRDYGATWQLITDGLSAPSFLRAVREDPQTQRPALRRNRIWSLRLVGRWRPLAVLAIEPAGHFGSRSHHPRRRFGDRNARALFLDSR